MLLWLVRFCFIIAILGAIIAGGLTYFAENRMREAAGDIQYDYRLTGLVAFGIMFVIAAIAVSSDLFVRHKQITTISSVYFGLLLGLGAGNGALGLARNLAHDFLALFFRHIFHQRFVSLLEFWIGVDAFHHALAHPLLAVELTHFVQDDGAFQPVTGHPLQVSPVLGIFFDVGVNLGLHFGIRPVSGRVLWRTCAGSAIRRGFGFCCCAHNEVLFFGCC